jgi:hypothetical protein
MDKNGFLELLKKATTIAFDFAKEFVDDNMPNEFSYSVELNASNDDPALTQFDLYPEDDDKRVEFINELEVVQLLYRKGKVPVWIDISVKCIYNNETVLRLLCAGRYSDCEDEFYYKNGGTGPFGIKSPILPIDYVQGRKFKIKVLKD